MIEVLIATGDYELARIRISNLDGDVDQADYSVEFAVMRGDSTGLIRRGIYKFPRRQYNALALVRQALQTLEGKELELDYPLGAPDMERRRRGALRSLQAWTSRLHHH